MLQTVLTKVPLYNITLTNKHHITINSGIGAKFFIRISYFSLSQIIGSITPDLIGFIGLKLTFHAVNKEGVTAWRIASSNPQQML